MNLTESRKQSTSQNVTDRAAPRQRTPAPPTVGLALQRARGNQTGSLDTQPDRVDLTEVRLRPDGGPTARVGGLIRRTCEQCEDSDTEEVRRASIDGAAPTGDGALDAALAADIDASRGTGHSLPGPVRAGFEGRFNERFGDVRIVTGATAGRLNDTLQARAFTVGNHIWFGRGEYRPTEVAGQRLIAHELAHTLQQRGSSPSIHTTLRLGSSSDPAEASADRAADAVMRGQTPAALAGDGPMLRRQSRTCSVTRGSEPDQLLATCGNDRFRVTFHLDSRREPETRVDVTPGINFNDVFFTLQVCRGNTRVRVKPSVNLTGALRDMVGNLVRGDPTLSGVTADPTLEVEITIDDVGTGTVRGGPIIDPRTGDVIGGGITLEIRPGRTERVDCTTERRFLRMRCERLTTVPGQPAQPASTHDELRHVYLLFPHAQFTPVREVRMAAEGQTPTVAATPEIAVQELAAQGFRVRSIEGFTSPEGPREQRRPAGFQGNDTLGQQRADEARRWLEAECAECGAKNVAPQGLSELYSPGTTPETEGRPLTRAVTPQFVGSDPLRPDTQDERDALAQGSTARQQTEIYPLLRRAHAVMERTVVDAPARPAVPAREDAEGVSCPAAVRRAVRNFLGLL